MILHHSITEKPVKIKWILHVVLLEQVCIPAYLLKIDEEEYGDHGALLQEGLFASFTLFLVLFYSFFFEPVTFFL
jgi:hypothetical protein